MPLALLIVRLVEGAGGVWVSISAKVEDRVF